MSLSTLHSQKNKISLFYFNQTNNLGCKSDNTRSVCTKTQKLGYCRPGQLRLFRDMMSQRKDKENISNMITESWRKNSEIELIWKAKMSATIYKPHRTHQAEINPIAMERAQYCDWWNAYGRFH